MRSSWTTWVGPQSNDRKAERDSGHTDVRDKARDDRGRHWRGEATSQRPEEARKDPPRGPAEGTGPCGHLMADPWLQKCKRRDFCCFKACSCWAFVVAAMETKTFGASRDPAPYWSKPRSCGAVGLPVLPLTYAVTLLKFPST